VIELALLLTPIAVLDSLSVVPMCIMLLILMLVGKQPYLVSMSLVFGIFVTYLAFAVAIVFGLQSVLDLVSEFTLRLWHNPETEEILLQIIIGFVLCLLGYRSYVLRNPTNKKPVSPTFTPFQAVLSGAALVAIGIPGAFPLFVAVDMVLRAELSNANTLLILVYYVLAFVAPLLVIIGLNALLGKQAQSYLLQLQKFIDRWWQRGLTVVLFLLGLLLIVDGGAWLLGTPLIPV